MAYSIDDPDAKSKRTVQYFEMFGNRAIYKNGWKALAWHKQGDDFANDKWELYHLEKDWTETNDLAKKYPEKLQELKELFTKEAQKYNVFPLDDRRQERLLEPKPQLFGERDIFIYYPGTSQIPETNAASTKNRSFVIKAFVDNKNENTNGVIIAHGGRFGGYSLYVKNDIPSFTYDFVGDKRFEISSSEKLPLGKSEIRFEFKKNKSDKPGAGGMGTLYIKNKKVGEGKIDATMGYRISLGEGLDIGKDTGSPVDESYEVPFDYNGTLEKVIVEIGKSHLSPIPKFGDY